MRAATNPSEKADREREVKRLQGELKNVITRGEINAWLGRNTDMNAETLQHMTDLTAAAQVAGVMTHRLRCSATKVVDLGHVPRLIPEDPDDDMVLEVARRERANYLVSDDVHLRQWGNYSFLLRRLGKMRRKLRGRGASRWHRQRRNRAKTTLPHSKLRSEIQDLEQRVRRLWPYRKIQVVSSTEFAEVLKQRDRKLRASSGHLPRTEVA
jgi:predicted nucleic acid-binding protein